MWKPVDFLVVGGGVIGLNLALGLRRRFAGARIRLLEKEATWGWHASGRNSGVLHAGFYYGADSLKARFCRDGNRELQEYCRERHLPLDRCGKLVVARSASDWPALEILRQRGQENGVRLEEVNEEEARRLEPRAKTVGKALFSPDTATIDAMALLHALVGEARQAGIELLPGVAWLGGRGQSTLTSAGRMGCGYLVNCAGLHADRIAWAYGFGANLAILPFKGLYLYGDARAGPLSRHVYPVPDLDYPFLGVHCTRTVDGRIKLGPTAIPAFWREHYQGWSRFSPAEALEVSGRMAGLWWRNDFAFRRLARQEMGKWSRRTLTGLAGELVGGIEAGAFTTWGRPGLRAQLVDVGQKRLEMDFRWEGDDRSFHVLNAVSPGLTCSMPFARYLVDRINGLLS
ncbi:MAG: FAD-dependent oxidoreductase [Magnetococcales bacterium]|nr:FAD-dependent oxidoreductase [Magnetococcales bacterium]